MLIAAVHIRNLCSAKDLAVTCESLTVLVGRNGAGKSTILRALELFYSPSPQLVTSDFYAEDVSAAIEVSVTFTNLPEAAKAQFAGYLDGDSLSVVRVFQLVGTKISAKYHGQKLQCAAFAPIRAYTAAKDVTAAYKQLREVVQFADLPEAKSKDAALDGLRNWETLHPESCTKARDDGQFFGFSEVAQGYLGRFTRLIRIPAVRDASEDANEGRGSPITQLMDLVVRRTLATKEEVIALRAEIKAKYKAIIDPTQEGEVSGLAAALSTTLKMFVPDAAVVLAWGAAGELDLPMPRADVRVREDGHLSPVERTGHGTQRAFILTLLQHLAFSEPSSPEEDTGSEKNAEVTPNLILLIEEPELYQHPTRQRHFASTLRRLAAGSIPGVASQTQVIYCTHSPLFVGLDRFDQVRLARKVEGEGGKPKLCAISSASLQSAADSLWKAWGSQGQPFDGSTLRTRLASIMTPWITEGFFADVVVLVEGESDRAALLTVASHLDIDLEAEGVAVLPCVGKPNIDRPAIIFDSLKIPVYLLWDADAGKKDPKPEMNRALCRIVGAEEQEYPIGSFPKHTVFPIDLETTLAQEMGQDLFLSLRDQVAVELGLAGRDAIKNPFAMREVITRAYNSDVNIATLEAAVGHIAALRGIPISATEATN